MCQATGHSNVAKKASQVAGTEYEYKIKSIIIYMYYLVYSFGTKSIFKIYYTYLTSYDATWPRKWSSHLIWQRNLQSNSSYHGLDFRFPFFFFVSVCGGGEGGGALKFAPNCGGCCKFKTNFLIKLLCPRVNSNYTAPHRHLASLSICQRYFIFCYFFFSILFTCFFSLPFFFAAIVIPSIGSSSNAPKNS